MIYLRRVEGDEWGFGIALYKMFGHDDYVRQFVVNFWKWIFTVQF